MGNMAMPALVYWEDPVLTGAVFGSVLVGLVSLASCSLITVASYSCLALLSGVLLVKLYSFVMVKAGKAEAGSDPLAKVAEFSLALPTLSTLLSLSCVDSSSLSPWWTPSS